MKLDGRFIEIEPGRFCVGPKPRGGDWLEVDIQNLNREGFTFVVSLLTEPENTELNLVNEETVCKRNGIEFYSFPIIDRSAPKCRKKFEDFAQHLLTKIKNGECGYFHCRAGLGRAPLLGCIIMRMAGAHPDEAWRMLAEARGQPVPDTEEQRAWVKSSQSATNLDDAFAKLLDNGNE
ncbi:MAG: tyrosine protein phosphatase [Vulcanimicrobiota bacterium]